MKVVIFTRHALKEDQRKAMASVLCAEPNELWIADLSALAAVDIKSREEARIILDKILAEGVMGESLNIFGVIPPVLRAELMAMDQDGEFPDVSVWVYEAWNVARSKEGERPTFEFKEWLLTGIYE